MGSEMCIRDSIKEAFDEEGNLIDEMITERVEAMANSLVDIARYLKSRR